MFIFIIFIIFSFGLAISHERYLSKNGLKPITSDMYRSWLAQIELEGATHVKFGPDEELYPVKDVKKVLKMQLRERVAMERAESAQDRARSRLLRTVVGRPRRRLFRKQRKWSSGLR